MWGCVSSPNKATDPKAIPAPYHMWRCLSPACAGVRVNSENRAKTKIIVANFLHIWNPSFLLRLLSLNDCRSCANSRGASIYP